MANITVTATTNSILVDFGALKSVSKITNGVWSKSVISFQLSEASDFVKVHISGETPWAVSFDGEGNTLKIDSVSGAEPTSNLDLFNKLAFLKQ